MTNFKEISIKNCTCYYFDDIIKFEDFDIENILTDEKLYENILVYNTYKIWIVQNFWLLGSIK